MQQALRPYTTAGIALVGASMIAVTPVAAPPPAVQMRPVQLVDAWSDLFTNTAANWQNVISNADLQAISQVFSEFLTNPAGVISAFANLTPTVTTDITSLPAQVTVELPPGLALGIAQLGDWGATLTAVQGVATDLASGNFEAIATVLNGYLNGQDTVSLLNGAITIPLWNGILAPLQHVGIDINLPALLDALGLGNTPLTNVDLSNLLDQLGLGKLNLGDLFNSLGLDTKGLGDLLGNPTLGGLLSDLGLGNLGLGQLSLTGILSGLGLDTNVDLNNLSLNTVLTAFGINPTIDLGLSDLLTKLGLGSVLDDKLGDLVALLPASSLQSILTSIGSSLDSVITSLPLGDTALATINAALTGLGLGDLNTLLTPAGLEAALNNVTVGDLLTNQTGIDETVSSLLGALGVTVPDNLTIGGILEALGFSSATGDLTLSGLLGDLGNGILGLNVGSLLNGLNLGDLLNLLDLSNLPLNLSDLGDLSGLNLGDLLGDLGLGNLADITVNPLGGYVTELLDVVPQQILAALG